ncbi:MAG TPA: D-alanyl-D-alanine carboxypeptidase, partial [Candidatus Cybelea sp.]|nr:D-alanyl-D-alanine carboxypeptidase [Candidatus Cybelea sp.]
MIGVAVAWLHSFSGTRVPNIVFGTRSARFSGEQALKKTSCFAGKSRRPENGCSQATSMPTPAAKPWSEGDRKKLLGDLNSAFGPVLVGADRWSLAVLASDGTTVYDNGANRGVAPASVMKLIVAATALNVLGGGYRYHTILASERAINEDGSI